MNSTDRNWLIRTSQNQILGPVAKAKVVEFIQKGALGMTDEVCSGNGYWFFLKEKDLVEKYLFGDVPQSYNPISEAKTVLARKLDPNKTTSINASPANITQIINLKNLNLNDTGVQDSTVVHNSGTVKSKIDDPFAKVPSSDDLEFPDIDLINQIKSEAVPNSESRYESTVDSNRTRTEMVSPLSLEDTKLPDNNDLEYPDMDFIEEVKKNAESVAAVTFQNAERDNISGEIILNEEDAIESAKLELFEKSKHQEAEQEITEAKQDKIILKDSGKLLHERKKIKPQAKLGEADPSKVVPKAPLSPREMAPDLKNRNDSYLLIIFIVLVLLIIGIIFYYYRFILNKPLPV